MGNNVLITSAQGKALGGSFYREFLQIVERFLQRVFTDNLQAVSTDSEEVRWVALYPDDDATSSSLWWQTYFFLQDHRKLHSM